MRFNIFRKFYSDSMKIDFKMANYPGMTLNNEIRESISLDEDDLSDVEDEVFIRDGKNSYKTAEEIYVKRPLMAPRRIGRHNISSKIRNKPPCRAFYKPCCYFLAALSVLIGLIVLVIILVSIFPLPLDRIHDWIISKFVSRDPIESSIKLLPCSEYKISDVWTINLPKLTSDSPIYLLDVNDDGVDDVLFGFGTGENYGILPNDIFCSVFMGVSAPCEGGIIALNGINGKILWRYWTNATIYFIHCSEDINSDGVNDCLIIGTEGTISLINTRNGTSLWNTYYNTQEDIIIASFIPDQNNDSVADILASHTNLSEKDGHIMLLSGKSGKIISEVPINSKTFYMPQVLHKDKNMDYLIYGSGGPSTPGNLSAAPLKSFFQPNQTSSTLYQDLHNGVMIQSVFVDITGDKVPDIITALYNSTVIAINGKNFTQIWNFTVDNSRTNFVPIPGYFNFDNTTDFLIVYETYDNILKYNFTQTFILDGKTGKAIYEKPISDSVQTQIGGVSVTMESHGYDMFLFWTSQCTSIEIFNRIDFPLKGLNVHPLYENCHHQENTTVVLKLNILNQFDQPPGIEIYNSLNRSILEFNNTKSPMQIMKEYLNSHPKLAYPTGQAEFNEGYDNSNSGKIGIHKYGNSNFRHKDDRKGLLKDFSAPDNSESYQDPSLSHSKIYNRYYEPIGNMPDEMEDYNTDEDINSERNIISKSNQASGRDPRSRTSKQEEFEEKSAEIPTLSSKIEKSFSSRKKDLDYISGGIYDDKNIQLAKHRLLHDLNDSPDEILSDTFYKNWENKLRSSKFEQRDLSSHNSRKVEEESINKMIEDHKKNKMNYSYNLWNMESEKEEEDRRNNYWRSNRQKREPNYASYGSLRKLTSVGALTQSLKKVNGTNSIDVIFLTFWQPTRYEPRENLEEELAECVEEKLASEGDSQYHKNTDEERRSLFFKDCVLEQTNLKHDFPYFNDIYKLNLGQMTVYRLRIECQCNLTQNNERCAKFSPIPEQKWPFYLGKNGNGVFG